MEEKPLPVKTDDQHNGNHTEQNHTHEEPHQHLMGQKVGSCTDANFPKDGEGRVYHLGVKRGEVANRILSVGDPRRAQTVAALLDNPEKNFLRMSNRGFHIYTGTKDGVPISVIATGMGFPMMDFVVRECRAIIDGPMLMIRLGTCGTVDPEVKIGSMAVASKGSVLIRRNPDAFSNTVSSTIPYYTVCQPVAADKELSHNLVERLRVHVKSNSIVEGLNATADTFYSSQGRHDCNFTDKNEQLIDQLVSAYPEVCTLEMETFHLFDLARVSCSDTIKTAATTIVLAQRRSNEFLANEITHRLEKEAGLACLETLASFPLDSKSVMNDSECVWWKKD